MFNSSLVIFTERPSPFIEKMMVALSKTINKNGTIIYSSEKISGINSGIKQNVDSNLSYLSITKNHRIYSNLLNYCEENNIHTLFISRLEHPEYLLAELKSRKLKTRIKGLVFGLQDAYLSKARATVYEELLAQPSFAELYISTIIGTELEYQKIIETRNVDKISLIFDPIYENQSIYQTDAKQYRANLGLSESDVAFLFFGSLFYGKGLDILFKSFVKIKNKRCKLIIASNPESKNYSLNLNEMKKNKNIMLIDRFIPNSDIGKLFAASNVVVLPYRNTYKWGTSGVFVQSSLAAKPIIYPNIYPFNSVGQKYSLGKEFQAENIKSLRNTINDLTDNYDEYQRKLKNKSYLKKIQSWRQFGERIIA